MSVAHFITELPDKSLQINLLVEGMHCPSCVAVIESALHKEAAVIKVRVNLSTRRLVINWQGKKEQADSFINIINAMGYHAVPFDPKTAETSEHKEEKFLLKCLAIAGFASGNLMLFSIPLWTSDAIQMGEATRNFFHWMQAVIAMPAIAYCGLPFYRSAWKALQAGHTNMDVPISVAVVLATGMSLFETISFGQHSYFDSAVMLLFFLLIGRYLEARARGKARNAAQDLLRMMVGSATVLHNDGTQEVIPLSKIKPGMHLCVAAGESFGGDGEVLEGKSEVDTSLITGETLPLSVTSGSKVFAGTINIAAPVIIKVLKSGERSLIAEIVRLMETAEQSQAAYVTLADKISGWYTPVVHALAAATFLGWWLLGNADWQTALLYAATVLIITCPCALGLAVPVVQVLASGKLMRFGILLKSGSALERLATITHAAFDKTGTLTRGKPELVSRKNYTEKQLQLAASMASKSLHPLSRAISREYQGPLLPLQVEEAPGFGLQTMVEGRLVRLGKREWCGISEPTEKDNKALELWLAVEGEKPVRMILSDQLRSDAGKVIDILKQKNIHVLLLSGDRDEVVRDIATITGIKQAYAALTPIEKNQKLETLKQEGASVLMVGDGLNDAPSLASATVSMSPATAMDITQNAADIVFQGEKLKPVFTAWKVACFSQKLVKENFFLAIIYNVIAIPMAVAGYVTPVIAAIAMSVSSLVVIANAMRLNLLKEEAL